MKQLIYKVSRILFHLQAQVVTRETFIYTNRIGQGGNIMHSLGTEIKKIRSQNKLSQEEFAMRINKIHSLSITKGMVSKWESGSIEPKTRMVKAIAETFNVSIDEILGLSIAVKNGEIETIAAHIDDDLTEVELMEIKKYIQFLKSQRK